MCSTRRPPVGDHAVADAAVVDEGVYVPCTRIVSNRKRVAQMILQTRLIHK